MKTAQDMLNLAQEVNTRMTQEKSIKVILKSIENVIEHAAQQGKTDVTIFTEEMGFDLNFPFTIGNLKVVAECVHDFGYHVSILMKQDTADMTLHVNWKPHPMDALLQDLTNAFGPLDRF